MTHGDILFLLIFGPLAALAIIRSARGDGVEIPSGKQLSALAIGALTLSAVSFIACWWWDYGWRFWEVLE
jgi:hypothetical protein